MSKNQCPVVKAAIEKLAKSTNPMSGITHMVDRSKAVNLFYALLDHGYHLEFQPIYDQLIGYGWGPERATEVGDLAELVSVDSYIEIDMQYQTTWGRLALQRILEANTLSETSPTGPSTVQQE